MEPKGIQSIEVGYRLLEALQDSRAPMPLKVLGERAGLSPSKARNYLISLMRVELVRQDPVTGRYGLGSAALKLGLSALGQIEPVEIIFEEMKHRQDSVQATLFLSVWGNKGPVIVRWLEGVEPTTVEVRSGSVLPATRSATGWAFLAHLPKSVSDPVVSKELESEPVPAKRLKAYCKDVTLHGVARIDGELLPGVAGMAVPILDHEARICAVVSAIGRRGRLNTSFEGELANQLRDLKSAAENRIGGSPLR